MASDYGIIKIGKEEINSTDYILEIQPEMDYFYFTSNNYNITNNYDIVYNISIKETYSAVCKITLKINACYQSCKNCFENIDSSTDENHNCIDCKEKENYFHYSEEENNCYNEQEMKQKFNHYYFDSQGRLFQKCNLACKTCNGPSENNCLSCENYLLYAYNGNCIPECPNKTFETTDIEGNKICTDCYPNCATCQELGTHANMSCSSCSNNQIKYEKNCFEISDNIIKSFHNSEDYNEITSCRELYGKYIIENTNECIDEQKIGYFVSNEQTGILSPCHPDCKTCSRNFTDSNTNCDSCSNETLIVLEGKCVENYSEGYFQNDTYSLKFSYNLILTDTGDYISECPNGTYLFNGNFTCLKYCPSNYEINEEQNACIIKSYAQTSSDEFKNQILTNITAFVNSSALINGSDFIAVILSSHEMDPKEQLKKGISAVDLGNCTKEIKEYYNISKNESLIILNMESKRNETKINEENNRNDNSFDVGKNSQIEIYDNAGRKLNLSVCKENIKIMKYIGDLKKELNIESAISFADSGIDVFNASDDFFNNICHEYNNKDGKDIIIDDRRTDIYKNVSFCEQGCTYKGMDYELMIANCICDSSIMKPNDEDNIASNDNNKEEKLNFKSLKNSFLESLFDFNFDVINCYNLVFNLKFLKSNIGFYSMMTLFIIQLICFFIYLFKKLKSLKKYLLLFNNSNPKTSLSFPPKKYNNSKTIQFNNNNQEKKLVKNSKKNFKNQKEKNKLFTIEEETNNECNTKRKICFMDDENNLENNFNTNNKDLLNLKIPSENNLEKKKGKKGKKLIFTNNFISSAKLEIPILNIQNKKQKKLDKSKGENIYSKKPTKEIKFGSKINNDKIHNFKKNNIIELKKNKKKNISNRIKSKNNEKNVRHNLETNEGKKKLKNDKELFNLYKLDEDLQDMDYEQAILYDKRSYLRIYWAFLVDTQIILGTFCTKSYLNLFIFKLSFLTCTFQISFFLNAFFYSDEYISDAYHNNGVLDFVSGLPKSIYSLVATLITTFLLGMLSNSKSELKQLIREKRQNKNYMNLINIKLRKLRIKLIVYFILVFSLGLLFLYYVSSFCSVYRNSQKYWFIGCLESFGMDSIVAIIVCIFLSLFRYIAIKRRIKCFYCLANLISTFL